jgi:hypothetical protein
VDIPTSENKLLLSSSGGTIEAQFVDITFIIGSEILQIEV